MKPRNCVMKWWSDRWGTLGSSFDQAHLYTIEPLARQTTKGVSTFLTCQLRLRQQNPKALQQMCGGGEKMQSRIFVSGFPCWLSCELDPGHVPICEDDPLTWGPPAWPGLTRFFIYRLCIPVWCDIYVPTTTCQLSDTWKWSSLEQHCWLWWLHKASHWQDPTYIYHCIWTGQCGHSYSTH